MRGGKRRDHRNVGKRAVEREDCFNSFADDGEIIDGAETHAVAEYGAERTSRRSDVRLFVTTGHPGSLTTLHADSSYGAFERLALMTLQSDLKLSKAEIMDYVRSVVPMVVQLRRRPTRGVAEIYFRGFGEKA